MTDLIPSNARTIKELEKLFQSPIPSYESLGKESFGMEIKNHSVIELSLFRNKKEFEEKRLKLLPSSIGNLTELKKLILDGNRIEKIPRSITNLKNLKVLTIEYNRLKRIPSPILDLKHIKKLDLSHNKIKSLPEKIGELSGLKLLDLEWNKLNVIPDSIEKLKNLKKLNLGSNNLKYVPKSIGELNKLEYLDLSSNFLVNIPETIASLNYLKFLDLRYCWRIKNLPECLKNLPSYTTIKISDENQQDKLNMLRKGNDKKFILDESNLPVMEKYVVKELLGSCNLDKQNSPIILLSLNELTEWKLRRKVRYISIENDHVVGLSLKGCEISNLPISIGQLSYLKVLILNQNKIKTLPNSIGNLKNLEHLDLAAFNWAEEKEVQVLPSSLGDLISLKSLNLSFSLFKFLPERMANLKSLERLFLKRCISQPLPELIGNLENLRELNLDSNNLTTFPSFISNLINLRVLSLKNNRLKEIPESIGNLTSLRILQLQKNELNSLPDSLKNLKLLRKIELQKNPELEAKAEVFLQGAILEKESKKSKMLGVVGQELKKKRSFKEKMKNNLSNPKPYFYALSASIIGFLVLLSIELTSYDLFTSPYFILIFIGVLFINFLIGIAVINTLSGYLFKISGTIYGLGSRSLSGTVIKYADLLFVYYLIYTIRAMALTIFSIDLIPPIGFIYEKMLPEWLVQTLAIFDYNLILSIIDIYYIFVLVAIVSFFFKALWFWSLYIMGPNPLKIREKSNKKHPSFLVLGMIAPLLIVLIEISNFNTLAQLGYSIGVILSILAFLWLRLDKKMESLFTYLFPVIIGVPICWILWLLNPIISIIMGIGFFILFIRFRNKASKIRQIL